MQLDCVLSGTINPAAWSSRDLWVRVSEDGKPQRDRLWRPRWNADVGGMIGKVIKSTHCCMVPIDRPLFLKCPLLDQSKIDREGNACNTAEDGKQGQINGGQERNSVVVFCE